MQQGGKLTPRERVRRAVQRESTDRIPIDFRAVGDVYTALRNHIGCSSDEEVCQRLHSDIRGLYKSYGTYHGPVEQHRPDGTFVDFWGIPYAKSVNAFGQICWNYIDPPLGNANNTDEIRNYPWPDPDWWDYDIADQLQLHTKPVPYWIGIFGSSILGRACQLRGMEQTFVDMMEEHEIIEVIFDKVTSFFINTTVRALTAAQGRIDMVESMDDYGSQNGLLISPPLWRRHIKPRLKKFNDVVKQHGAVVYQHSCGSIMPLIDDLIEIGTEVLDPLQFSAHDMAPATLMSRFSSQLTFHGGMDIQQVVPRLPIPELLTEAQRIIDVMAVRHGYIFAGTHYFQVDATPEKIIALFDFASRYSPEKQS
ncbi:MAG: hypothetical protein KJ964_10525 [Verrucomicrobia bacterium]|nr:hypothetical protein [Verrucomicrobiota bacterium]MBU1858001.1 hypothetical protein [Verrucomicrobiota bacterium]